MSADLKMNYIINEDETEINIKDLLTYCFLHWRKALALMLIAAIILGGVMGTMEGIKTAKLATAYQAYLDDPAALKAKQENTNYAQKNGIELPADEILTAEEQQILEEVVTLDSINNMNDIISQSRRDLMSLTDYFNNSILMRVDPQYVPTVVVDVMITVPEGAPANAANVIAASYVDYIKNGNYLDDFALEAGIEVRYLKEAISVTDTTFGNIGATPDSSSGSGSSGSTNISTDLNVAISTDEAVDRVALISINVVSVTADDAFDIMDRIIAELDAYSEATSESMFENNVTLVNYYFNYMHNDTIQNLQTKTSEELVDLQENLEIYIKSLKNLQKQHGDIVVNTMNKMPNAPLEGCKTGIKFGGIAFFAAFLFYALILMVRYIITSIALTKSQFVNRFALFDLGSERDGEEKLYKHNGKFDKWLRKKGRLGSGDNDVFEAVAANLAVYGSDIKSILVIGSGKNAKGLKDKIKDRKIINADSLMDNPLARKQLLEVDGIVLEVKYGQTKFEDIKEELKLIMLTDKPVIGYIAD